MKNTVKRIVAIHQPNFFPWLGYFNKIFRSDVFVFLTHVKSSSTQSYSKRVRILSSGKSSWLTVPICKSDGRMKPLNKFEIKTGINFEQKHLKTIKASYSKSPYFNDVFPTIENYYKDTSTLLVNRNINIIKSICKRLEIQSVFYDSSDFCIQSTSNEMLASLVSYTNSNTYLCGGGSSGYFDESVFKQQKIEITYQDFQHPVYKQRYNSEFIPGLSIIDTLMNCGFDETSSIIRTVS